MEKKSKGYTLDPCLLAEIHLQEVVDRHPKRKLRVRRSESDPHKFQLLSHGLLIAEGPVEAFAELVVGFVADAIEFEASQALQDLHSHTFRRNVLPIVKTLSVDQTGSARPLLMTVDLVRVVSTAWQERKELEDERKRSDEKDAGGTGSQGGAQAGGAQEGAGSALQTHRGRRQRG